MKFKSMIKKKKRTEKQQQEKRMRELICYFLFGPCSKQLPPFLLSLCFLQTWVKFPPNPIPT